MYNYNNSNNNGGMTSPPPPLSDYRRNEPTVKRPVNNNNNNYKAAAAQPNVAVLAFTVLLCLFGCSLTVALSYKWHADAGRQINALLGVVDDLTCDLKRMTVIIREELVAKRMRKGDDGKPDSGGGGGGGGGGGSTTTAKVNSDYDDSEDDDVSDQFMDTNLSDNNWPTKTFIGSSVPETVSVEQSGEVESENGRRRRNAEVDAKRAVAKNQLNGSNYEKSIVESVQDDANEENTVKTYGRRRPKKMSSVRKKPETGVSYELKETHDGIAAAAHFISDPSKYNTAVHPHYDGNGRLKHPDGEFKDWTAHIWDADDVNSANHFQMKNGKVDVSKSGIYFVYAQIYYSDQHDINGYYIMKNNEKILGCTTTRHQNNQSDSCYTGGLIYLNSKDIISIKGLDSERYILLDPVKSFFGLFQVSSKDAGKR